MKKTPLLTILTLLLLLPLAAPAMPCHCFTARTYDPGQPASADPYFLATTQNSFFSAVFGVEKKSVVFAKQKGTRSEDLWVAFWSAARTGADPEELLMKKGGEASWKGILAGVGGGPLPAQFLKLLDADAPVEALSHFVVDAVLISRNLAEPEGLDVLRKAGASDQETILAAFLACRTGRKANEIFREVRAGETTWGSALWSSGMNGNDMAGEIDALLVKAKG